MGQLNVTAQFTKHIKLRPDSAGELPEITSLVISSMQGTKYFVLGDTRGVVSAFTRNGTFHGQVNTTRTLGERVEGLHGHFSNLIFRTGFRWGFINLDRMEVEYLNCPKFNGRVISAIIDSHVTSRVFVSDEEGTVWVLNIKDKKHCK